MSTFLPTLLTWLQMYGYPMLWVCICVASVGLPLPISLVLLAAGAFAALGDFNIFLLALVAVTASVSGDSLSYLLGRRIGTPIFDWLAHSKRFRLLTPQHLTQAQDYFTRRGAWAIFLSRFLFSGLGSVINLLAGAERYPYRRFLLFDFSGEVLGASIPLILGYIFGASWEAVGDIMGASSGFAIALFVVIALAIQLIKTLRNANPAKESASAKKSVSSGATSARIPLLPQQAFLHENEPPEALLP
ncbi:MAG: hypothetical protein NVSMB49_25180 [Ktedonobacteraceae bacterium]